MSEKYAAFAERFGEEEADRILMAAEQHANGINDRNRGSDFFKWALLITIGYECWSSPDSYDYHAFTSAPEDIKAWIKEHGEIDTHDGDFDYLALFVGKYNEYVSADDTL